MKLKSNQSGIAHVAAIVLVLIIAVIGIIGWKVWDGKSGKKNNDTNSSSNTPASNEDSEEQAATNDDPNTWYQFASKNGEYKIRLANGLTFKKIRDDSTWFSIYTENLLISSKSPAQITETTDKKDSGTGMYINYYETGTETKGFGTLQSSFKTDSGLQVKKYSFTAETEMDSLNLKKGEKMYVYHISQGGVDLVIRYGIAVNGTEYVDLIEKMVKTVELK